MEVDVLSEAEVMMEKFIVELDVAEVVTVLSVNGTNFEVGVSLVFVCAVELTGFVLGAVIEVTVIVVVVECKQSLVRSLLIENSFLPAYLGGVLQTGSCLE